MKKYWKLITIAGIFFMIVGTSMYIGDSEIAPMVFLISIAPSLVIAVW